MPKRVRHLCGTATPDLTAAIAAELEVLPGACAIERFPDGEISAELLEPVRRRALLVQLLVAASRQ